MPLMLLYIFIFNPFAGIYNMPVMKKIPNLKRILNGPSAVFLRPGIFNIPVSDLTTPF